MRGGFSLIEVVVALVVLELGLLGVMSVLVEASRTSGRAARTELGAASLEGVADSLFVVGWGGDGRRPGPPGALSWWAAPDSSLVIDFDAGPDRHSAIRLYLAAGTFR